MERWGPKCAAPEPVRTGRRLHADQPSFSSTLLDAIYKSMDEPGDEPLTSNKKRVEDELRYGQCYYRASLAGSYRAGSRPHAATTSSSSDCSSYGGFSSSEAESSQHRRLRPIRTTVTPVAPAAAPEKKPKKERPGAAIRAKLRDLRKPASPGARLAGFLNSIFAGGGGGGKHKASAESACSTASSSYSRSCLSKTPSTRGGQPNRRTVRFVDSDVDATPASRRAAALGGVVHLEQMLLRRMEMESDDDDDSSDASSDLFELENLATVAPAAAGGSAAYRDELPVYETTRVVLNHSGIGHGYAAAHGRSTRVV